MVEAYLDDEGIWRCAKCHAPIDVDGECPTTELCYPSTGLSL